MDWERSRRFDDHRGRESYRPATSRSYSRHTSPARVRSPRLVADTWVPPSSRLYGRLRSRSPFPLRNRSRSPSFRHRDVDHSPYTNTPQRKLSPRRDVRPRSPPQLAWRPRSPYGDQRSYDISHGRSTPRRGDPTPPRQDYRPPKQERYYPPAPDQLKKSASPLRRGSLRDSDSRPSISHRPRTPPQGFLESYPENTTAQTRPSPSTRDASIIRNSASSTVSNSRRSSPLADRFSVLADDRGRSPVVTQYIPQRRPSRSDHFTSRQEQKGYKNEQASQDKPRDTSTVHEQTAVSLDDRTVLGSTSDRPTEYQKNLDRSSNSVSASATLSQPKTQLMLESRTELPNTSVGLKLSSQARGSAISLLSAPTRPRGGPNLKDNNRTGNPVRRGPIPIPHVPPTGPRNSHVQTGLPVDSHRQQHTYRHNSLTEPYYHRTQRHVNHLAGLPTIIPGGRPLPCDLDTVMEKRLTQLDLDKERLFEQITDSQRLKRLVSRDWDKLDRESSICALKSELAEGHLQGITDGERIHVGATF